jgi:hypothetical protein
VDRRLGDHPRVDGLPRLAGADVEERRFAAALALVDAEQRPAGDRAADVEAERVVAPVGG